MAFDDTPPQVFLDEIHAVNVPALFRPEITQRQRKNLIQLARGKLAETKQGLQRQIGTIRDRYDKDDQEAADKAVRPYMLLDGLINELGTAISDLEKTMNEGGILPQSFVFGDVIFGSQQTGEWFLGGYEDEERWETLVRVRSRLGQLSKERAPLRRKMETAKARLDEVNEEISRKRKRYERSRKRRGLALRMVTIFLIALISGVAGFVLFFDQNNPAGIVIIALCVVCLFLIPLTVLRRRRALEDLKDEIRALKLRQQKIKTQGQQLRRRYLPLTDTIDQLQREYSELRATFQ